MQLPLLFPLTGSAFQKKKKKEKESAQNPDSFSLFAFLDLFPVLLRHPLQGQRVCASHGLIHRRDGLADEHRIIMTRLSGKTSRTTARSLLT